LTFSEVVHQWYSLLVPTRHNRIQVTEDHGLAAALRLAAPHLPAGLPRSQQVRELAIVGAQHLAEASPDGEKRRELLEKLADHFREPESAPWDWQALREGKHRAWPIR
jgi:hypothetical protein